jgi:hypothetical protein
MKHLRYVTALCSFAVLLPGSVSAGDAEYQWIDGLDAFSEEFVGPKIMDPEDSANYFVILDDGAIEGTWYGKELAGEWRWEDGYFCRSLSAPRPAPEDCQQWSLGDGTVRLVRDRGAGEATIYALGK